MHLISFIGYGCLTSLLQMNQWRHLLVIFCTISKKLNWVLKRTFVMLWSGAFDANWSGCKCMASFKESVSFFKSWFRVKKSCKIKTSQLIQQNCNYHHGFHFDSICKCIFNFHFSKFSASGSNNLINELYHFYLFFLFFNKRKADINLKLIFAHK